eukprot:scaffold1830_cov246-Pinguiococcus_pyrenoidosus.AAC.3
MVVAAAFRVVHNGLADLVDAFQMPCHVVCGRRRLGLIDDLGRSLQLSVVARQADAAEVIASPLVEDPRLLEVPNGLAVGCPPTLELGVGSPRDVLLEVFEAMLLEEHPGNLAPMGLGAFVVPFSLGEVADGFKVPREGMVRCLEVDAILAFCHLQCPVPEARRLIQLVQQIVSATLVVQPLRVVEHAELNGNGGDDGLVGRIGFAARLPNGRGASSVSHIAEADLCDVKPLRLDTHVRHVLPDARASNQLHRPVRGVHVPRGEAVAESKQRFLHIGINVLQADEVSHDPRPNDLSSYPHVSVVLWPSRRRRVVRSVPATAEIDLGHADPKERVLRRREREGVLEQDAVVRRDKHRHDLDLRLRVSPESRSGLWESASTRAARPCSIGDGLASLLGIEMAISAGVVLRPFHSDELDPAFELGVPLGLSHLRGGAHCCCCILFPLLLFPIPDPAHPSGFDGEELGIFRVPENPDRVPLPEGVAQDHVACRVVDVDFGVRLPQFEGSRAANSVTEQRHASSIAVHPHLTDNAEALAGLGVDKAADGANLLHVHRLLGVSLDDALVGHAGHELSVGIQMHGEALLGGERARSSLPGHAGSIADLHFVVLAAIQRDVLALRHEDHVARRAAEGTPADPFNSVQLPDLRVLSVPHGECVRSLTADAESFHVDTGVDGKSLDVLGLLRAVAKAVADVRVQPLDMKGPGSQLHNCHVFCHPLLQNSFAQLVDPFRGHCCEERGALAPPQAGHFAAKADRRQSLPGLLPATSARSLPTPRLGGTGPRRLVVLTIESPQQHLALLCAHGEQPMLGAERDGSRAIALRGAGAFQLHRVVCPLGKVPESHQVFSARGREQARSGPPELVNALLWRVAGDA